MMTTSATQENMTLTKKNADLLSSASSSHFHPSYSEREAHETDVLMKLRSNLAQLEDLHGRLRFAMSEIAYLIKRP